MIGKTVGHYQITEKLGEGGMGIVFLANDISLGRKVALKFLSQELLQDPVAHRRLLREAKAAAALDHPNICNIHEVAEAEGQNFIVMEYVEGQTLGDRLRDGPLPVNEALQVASEVAEALDEAHEKGIIHRDLKPANIMLTCKGRAKVMDFGLAKQVIQTEAAVTQEESLTALTRGGSTLGTLAYMSPEQLRGQAVDARSDIFSFGIVFYEMLTGVHPFRKAAPMDTASAILSQSPPPLPQYLADAPSSLQALIRKMLAKDSANRYPSAAALRDELRAIGTKLLKKEMSRALRPHIAIPVLAAALLLAVAAGIWYWLRGPSAHWGESRMLPQIARLAEEGKYVEAFRLAREARRDMPANAELAKVWEDVSFEITIESDPPGADVSVREYQAPDNAWIPLGETPLAKVRIPRSYQMMWRLSKPGYGVTYDARPLFGARISFKLDPELKIPEDMVRVPALGDSIQGSWSGLEPVDPPTSLSQYLIDRYEVTNRQFKQFVDAMGYQKTNYWKEKFVKAGHVLSWEEAMKELRDATGRPGPSTWEGGTFPEGQADYPVSGVSWYEAAAYAEFVGRALPTVFHWMRAAGGPVSAHIVPYSNFGGGSIAPIGKYRGISPYGNSDMAGNVREWCWNENSSQRYILGGAYNQPSYMFVLSDFRPPFDRSAINGFRCVRYTSPVPPILLASRGLEKPLDYSKVKPAPVAIVEAYRRMYVYQRTALNAKVESVEDDSSYWRLETITFDAPYSGPRMIAQLYLPKNIGPPYQAVVFFPGSGAMMLPSIRHPEELGRFDYIIKSGRAFLYPVYWGTYERQPAQTSEEWSPVRERDEIIMRFKELARSIDYLESRKDVDANRLAFVGFSWGGWLGPLYCYIEPRLKTCILVDGGLPGYELPPEVDPFQFAPHLKTPVLMLNGSNDFFFPVETNQRVLYRLLGTPAKDKRHIVFPTAHDVSVMRNEVMHEVLGWLDHYLGPVKMQP
jgi:dienelactone hydrolase/predicted Ser/Thr protein kinase